MRAKIRNERRRNWLGRRDRTRRSLGSTDRVHLLVYRSLKHIYAQLVDPATGKTLGGVSTRSKGVADGLSATGNSEAAAKVGAAIAALAKEKNIDRVVFNRNGFLYHGRVKALADAAREAGLDL